MMEGFREDIMFPRVYKSNEFTQEDFEVICEMLQCENLDPRYKDALLSLLKAYCDDLYCSECQGSARTSSTGGICQWNNNMPVSLKLNDGPLMWYPADCPIRRLLKNKTK